MIYSNMIAEVIEYDLEERSVLVKDSNNNQYRIKINAEIFQNCEIKRLLSNDKGNSANFLGYSIDEKMKTVIPIGNQIVIESIMNSEIKENITYIEACGILRIASEEETKNAYSKIFNKLSK